MPLPYRQQMANTLTSKELRERQDEYTYVDVREADKLEEGMIEGAMNIPLVLLIRKARNGNLDDLKRKKIVTYCSGGYRGNIAADELNKLGSWAQVTEEIAYFLRQMA